SRQWIVRASRSKVLKKMLKSDEFKTSAIFVKFIYSDGSMLSSKMKQHVRALYLAADKYKILQLRELCRSELISSLAMENALDFLELAQTPFDKALNDAALSYIKANELRIPSFDKFKLFADSFPDLTVEMLEASLVGRSCYNCGYINDHNRNGKSCSNCGFDRPCCS
ncbi:hypothetical protein CARUB_v10016207mg, partial [Capsella rubella]